MRAWERNAANLAASLSFYGTAEERGGVLLITSPVNYSVFNIALLTQPVSEIEGEMDRRIQVARSHFERLGRQWSFWVCEQYLGERTARRLAQIFEARRMAPIADSPGMEIDALPPPRRHLPEMAYRQVADHATRAAFADLVSNCFHIPPVTARQVYESEAPWSSPLEVWLGYLDGHVVASAAVIEAGGGLGIYSVATLAAWRGRGIAEAVMRHAIGNLRARGAQGPLLLQSSPSGLDLYQRLGFKKVTRWFVFATS